MSGKRYRSGLRLMAMVFAGLGLLATNDQRARAELLEYSASAIATGQSGNVNLYTEDQLLNGVGQVYFAYDTSTTPNFGGTFTFYNPNNSQMHLQIKFAGDTYSDGQPGARSINLTRDTPTLDQMKIGTNLGLNNSMQLTIDYPTIPSFTLPTALPSYPPGSSGPPKLQLVFDQPGVSGTYTFTLFNVQSVPEPATITAFAAGMAGMLRRKR